MSEQKTVFNRLFKKEELASQKVELAVTDDINFELKNIKGFLDKANKADANIQKLVTSLNSNYSHFANNMGYAKGRIKVVDSLSSKFQKLAGELGIDAKGTESFKTISLMYDYLSQIEDTLGNMTTAIKSIGK